RQGFSTKLRLWRAVTTLAQGLDQPTRGPGRDRQIGVRQQLAEHAAGLGVERHAETQIELVFGVIGALAGERKALRVGSSRVHFDLSDRLVFGAVHAGGTSRVVERYAPGKGCQEIGRASCRERVEDWG